MHASNARRPDVAVVTGDMVTSGIAYHERHRRIIGELRAKHGVFASMGNHDYFGEGEPLVGMLRARGVNVLRNEGARSRRTARSSGSRASTTRGRERDDIETRARGDKPAGAPVVLLAHDPQRFPQAAKRGVALTLAGHTHGGQIAFPFLSRWVSLSHLAHKFHLGMYTRGARPLRASGLGTTGPPMRLGVAPAVVILTLRAA